MSNFRPAGEFSPYPMIFYPHPKNVRNMIIVADESFLAGQKVLVSFPKCLPLKIL